MIELRCSVAILAMAAVLHAQAPPPVNVPPGFGPRPEPSTSQPAEQPPAPKPAAKPAAPGQVAAPAA